MKILHILEDFSLKSGGLRTVVKNLDFYLKSIDIESHIISSNKEEEDSIQIITSNNPWMYNKVWKQAILNNIEQKKIDIVHIHGVWMYPQYIAAKICAKKHIPFILTPHGMYEPWLWKKSTFKKKLYFKILASRQFSKAKYIHGITDDEVVNLQTLFKSNKFIEIPNLISVKDSIEKEKIKLKYLLYLGRLDSKKGITLLLEAFAKVSSSDFTLKIAGPFNEYKEVLDKFIVKLDIGDKVEFLGLIRGKEKEKIIKNSWVLVAPSYSEVIGMVNLEAASFKTPVITTHQTGIKKEWNKNGGFLINPNVDDLCVTLKKVAQWSEMERNINGENLFKFVQREYSWENKLECWKKVYENTLNK